MPTRRTMPISLPRSNRAVVYGLLSNKSKRGITLRKLRQNSIPTKLQGRPQSAGVMTLVLLAITWLVSAVIVPAQAEFVAEGVQLTPLTEDGRCLAVAWAYHGHRVAFVREISGAQKQLLIMNADGSSEQTVCPVGNPFFAEWSWSGEMLSYEFSNANDDESQGGVYIYDVEGRTTVPVSAPHRFENMSAWNGPFWSADDRYVAYQVQVGPSRSRQLWVADVVTGEYTRLLPELGEAKEMAWSPGVPAKIVLQIQASGDEFDIATVQYDSSEFVRLTDIGAQTVSTGDPGWSPTGEWVTYTNDIDWPRAAAKIGREDCWIARPDGSEVRNLTNAVTPETEKQISFRDLFWSWDGRWILGEGNRYDKQGNSIDTYYLIDPVNGGYRPIMTSYPESDSQSDKYATAKWSYDNTKILFVIERATVRSWDTNPQFENTRWILALYDVQTGQVEEILAYDEQIDRKQILGTASRNSIEDVSWSPDNRSVLLTIATLVSKEDEILQPNVYRLDLPERLIAPTAAQHIGPRRGRATATAATAADGAVSLRPSPEPSEPEAPSVSAVPTVTSAVTVGAGSQIVTEAVIPQHMTVEEASETLPSVYAQYVTVNTGLNLLLFKGPPELLEELRHDLALIDKPPTHILVDLLAVELSDEANRSLGLDWTYSEGHFGFVQPAGNLVFNPPPDRLYQSMATLQGVGQTFYQGVGELPREFYARLNTLVNNGEATILANPRTVGTSGNESLINIRKTVNFFFNEGFDTSGRPVVKKSDITAETIGRITPTLLADGQIHLLVNVSVGTFTFTQEAGLPEQTTRMAETEVSVHEEESIVIGGLRQQERSSSRTKVPLLGSIPLIKPFFTQDDAQIKHSVLTIFISPRILRPGADAPEWPQLNGEDERIVPIMEEAPVTKRLTRKVLTPGASSARPRPEHGKLRRFLNLWR